MKLNYKDYCKMLNTVKKVVVVHKNEQKFSFQSQPYKLDELVHEKIIQLHENLIQAVVKFIKVGIK